jgi:hypothetical protein
MGLIVHRAEACHRDVGVELSGRQCRVAEQLLHDPQVGTAFE